MTMVAVIPSTGFLLVFAISSVSSLQVDIVIDKSPVKLGENANLICRIQGLPAGHFIYWTKTVRVDGADQIELIATSGVVNTPYLTRYKSTVASDGNGQQVFTLTVTATRKEDRGNIGCVVPKGSEVVEDTGAYIQLDVLGPVDSVTFENYTSGQTIEFTESVPGKVSCWVNNATMLALPHVRVGEREVSNSFTKEMKEKAICTGNQASKQCIIHTLTSMYLHNEGFTVTHEDHGKRLNCSATIIDYDLPPVSAYLDVKVNFKPKFLCHAEQGAVIHSKNANVTCTVKAHPPLTSVYWLIKQGESETRLEPGDTTAESYRVYEPKAMPGSIHTKVVLGIRTVYQQNYIPYKLVVNNAEGTSDFTVRFTERTKPVGTATSVHLSYTLLVVCLLALLR